MPDPLTKMLMDLFEQAALRNITPTARESGRIPKAVRPAVRALCLAAAEENNLKRATVALVTAQVLASSQVLADVGSLLVDMSKTLATDPEARAVFAAAVAPLLGVMHGEEPQPTCQSEPPAPVSPSTP